MSAELERQAFLEALAACPTDRVTRQVFADWLEERGEDEAAEFHRRWSPEWQAAKEWLENFCEEIREDEDKVPLTAVVEAGYKALDGDYSCVSGCGFTAEEVIDQDGMREAFWENWSTYTRTEVDEGKRQHDVFSCSC